MIFELTKHINHFILCILMIKKNEYGFWSKKNIFSTKGVYVFEWQDLYFVKFGVEIGIDAFKSLNFNQEESLILIKKNFEDKLKNDVALNSLKPEQKGSYFEQVFERERITILEIQRKQRFAIILSIFSFFEGQLKGVCTLIEQTYNFNIKIDDLNSNEDLLRYWNYLEKVFEIDTLKVEPSFTPIKQQKIVTVHGV